MKEKERSPEDVAPGQQRWPPKAGLAAGYMILI